MGTCAADLATLVTTLYAHLSPAPLSPAPLRVEVMKTDWPMPGATLDAFSTKSARSTAEEVESRGDDPELADSTGAEGGTRTPTPLRAHDPESCASANSATSARAGPQ